MTTPPLITVSPTQLPKAPLPTGDMYAMVYREGGPAQGLAFSKLLARLIKTDLVKTDRASLNLSLAWDADSVALVHADPVSAYNGWYRKTGANGAGRWVQFEELAKSVRAAAEAARDASELNADRAEAAAAIPAYNARVQRAALRRAALGDTLRPGLVDPADLGWADWEYPAAIKYYSDGCLVWPLIKVTPAWREEWALGDIVWRDPADASIWRSINPAWWRDQTRQGTAFTPIYFKWTGTDAIGGGRGLSEALPFKTLGYAWAYAMANPICRIVCLDKWVGANSLFDTYTGSGFTGNLRVDQHVSVIAAPDDLSGRSFLLPMQESHTAAALNFQNLGDGLFMCAEAGIPDSVKLTPDMWDLGKVDLDGGPTPMNYTAGAFADVAAIKAGVPFGSWWVDAAATPKKLYVRRFDGAAPLPGVNWAYSEYSPTTTVMASNGKVAVFDGFVRLGNAAATDNYAWDIRPTVVTNSGDPWTDKTGEVWFTGCEAYGAAGGGFVFRDIRRGGCVLRVVKHCRLDGFNNSTFQTYPNIAPGDPNRTREGRDIHLLDMHGITMSAGQTGFRNQLAPVGSSNGPTEHSQCRTTSLSSITVDVNGCPLATVSGARGFHIDPFAGTPTIADGAGVPKALIWNDGTSDARAAGDLTVQSVTNVIGGGGPFSTSVWSHAVTNNGLIRQAGWKGQVRTKLTSGTVTNTLTGAAL